MVEDSSVDTEFVECPRCAEHVRPRALVCRFCGFDRASGLPENGRSAPPLRSAAASRKSAGVAGLLSLVLPGLGHFYVGEIAKGVGFLFGTGVMLTVISVMAEASKHTVKSTQGLVAFAAVLAIVLCISSIVSAVRAAHRVNARGADSRRAAEDAGDEQELSLGDEARTAIMALLWIIGGVGVIALLFKLVTG